MTLEELLRKHFDEDKVSELLKEMAENKIYTASEENLDTRYAKLKGDFESKTKEHDEAIKLIEQMKESAKGNEDLEGKIATYDEQIAALQKELEKTKLDSALKVALAEAKVSDVGYIAFKIKEQGELALDDDGNIKNIANLIKDMQTAYPAFFEGEKGGDAKEIEVNDLKKGEPSKGAEPENLEQALAQKYNQN